MPLVVQSDLDFGVSQLLSLTKFLVDKIHATSPLLRECKKWSGNSYVTVSLQWFRLYFCFVCVFFLKDCWFHIVLLPCDPPKD